MRYQKTDTLKFILKAGLYSFIADIKNLIKSK